jgi:hypothetical protein
MEVSRKTAQASTSTDTETRIYEIEGAIVKSLARLPGRFKPILDPAEESLAIRVFATYYVECLLIGTFNDDKSALSSQKRINLIEDTYENLIRIELVKIHKKLKQGEKEAQPSPQMPAILEWEIGYPDLDTIAIYGPSRLEIIIKEFNPALAQKSSLDLDIECHSVGYPIERPNEFSEECVWLEVTTITNWEKFTGKLNVGSAISWEIPYDFAKSLQSLLITSVHA